MRLTRKEEKCLTKYILESLNLKSSWAKHQDLCFNEKTLNFNDEIMIRYWYTYPNGFLIIKLSSPIEYSFRWWNNRKIKSKVRKVLEYLDWVRDNEELMSKRKRIDHILNLCQ